MAARQEAIVAGRIGVKRHSNTGNPGTVQEAPYCPERPLATRPCPRGFALPGRRPSPRCRAAPITDPSSMPMTITHRREVSTPGAFLYVGVSRLATDTCVTTMASMAARRLPRNTRKHPTRLTYAIESAKKNRLDALARLAGVSSAVFTECVIDHLEDELGDDGLPTWWPPASVAEQEELPLKRTA